MGILNECSTGSDGVVWQKFTGIDAGLFSGATSKRLIGRSGRTHGQVERDLTLCADSIDQVQTSSLVYWGGILATKRNWLQLDPSASATGPDIYTCAIPWITHNGEARPLLPYRDQPELVSHATCASLLLVILPPPEMFQLTKLLHRCGPNLKMLVISSTTLSPNYPDAAFDKTAAASLTRSLIRCALREAPCLETLIANCPMDSGQILDIVESAWPSSQLKRIHLIGIGWPDDGMPYYQDPNWRYITSAQFERVLAALPALECLDLRSLRLPVGRDLSFSSVTLKENCLRELLLPHDWQLTRAFPTGQQLRDVISQFPLLERLGCLTIQRRSEYGEITQADLDFFCANAARSIVLLQLIGGMRVVNTDQSASD